MDVVLDYTYPKVKIRKLVELPERDVEGVTVRPSRMESRLAVQEVLRALNVWYYEQQ